MSELRNKIIEYFGLDTVLNIKDTEDLPDQYIDIWFRLDKWVEIQYPNLTVFEYREEIISSEWANIRRELLYDD